MASISSKETWKEFFTCRELADRYRVCCHTIRAWERRGLLKAEHINARVVRFPASEVQRFEREALG